MAFAPDPSVHRQSVDGIQPITVLWQSPCYDVSRHGTVVIPEQPRVDDGTCRGRGDKVVMVSLLTWLSLTSCLLSCNGMTRAARRGNEKIWILGENKIKLPLRFCSRHAIGIFYLPNNRAGFLMRSVGTIFPARAGRKIIGNRLGVPARLLGRWE